jgi:DNA (cytosine-5)-methyltransferase 1
MISCIDLFCGLGGLTHGLTKGGVRVVAGVDIDPQCRFPYEQNNKMSKFIEQDVRKLKGDDLKYVWTRGSHTLLAGCAPCQSFSTYSRRGRELRTDTKWDLVASFGRLVDEVQPDLVTMENVPQLLHHKVFSKFLRCLADYHVWFEPIQCAHYRVPQRRKRLVLLASRIGPIALPPPLVKEDDFVTVRRAISHLPQLAAGESDPRDKLHSACRLSDLNLRRIRVSTPGGTWRDWHPSLVANCHKKATGDTYPSVYGRMEWDGPAPTITTQSFGYGNGRFGHPEQDRAITLREAAILQTFPDTYQFLREGEPVRFNVLGRLIGNAVPVRLGEIVAQTLIQHVRRRVARKR